MRYLALALVAALAAAGVVLPEPDEPAPLASVGAEEPAVSVCPVQEGGGRSTEVAILSTVNGPTLLTLFAGGGSAGSLGTETGASGSTVIPVGDVAAVGSVGGLVELPAATSASGVVITGAASLMAEACASVPSPQAFLTGGSTVSGETFALQLMNPYAGEAIVSLTVTSEAGTEANDRFNSVVVPPRASRLIDFNSLIPGRESLSVAVDTVLGRVIAVGQQGVEAESSIWSAVSGAQDWFLPIPKGGAAKSLILATPSAIEVGYQIDFYGPQGLEEGLLDGVLDARGRVEIDLAAITEEAAGIRIISTGPVVPTLRIDTDAGLATTTASTAQANRWMLPGASAPEGGGAATVVILNASIEDSTVSIRPLRDNSAVRSLPLPSDSVVEIGLEPADGYLIDSTSPVVVLWASRAASGGSVAIGVPLDDG